MMGVVPCRARVGTNPLCCSSERKGSFPIPASSINSLINSESSTVVVLFHVVDAARSSFFFCGDFFPLEPYNPIRTVVPIGDKSLENKGYKTPLGLQS